MHGIEQGREYAILTNEISKAWSGMTTRQYKDLKELKKQNLRDNMSTTELVAKVARETLEKETGEPVITSKNTIDFGKLIGDVVKEITNSKEDDKAE